MLVKVENLKSNAILDMIAKINGNDNNINVNMLGIKGQPSIYYYEIGHFNFDEMLPFELDFNEKYPNFNSGLSNSGVCDNPTQLFSKHPEISASENKYVVSFTKIRKESQPTVGGWRWDKWGEYIGDKEPKNEYLYDENESITEVYVYQILDVSRHV